MVEIQSEKSGLELKGMGIQMPLVRPTSDTFDTNLTDPPEFQSSFIFCSSKKWCGVEICRASNALWPVG